MIRNLCVFLSLLMCIAACKQKSEQQVTERQEDKEAKKMLQGIWLDESENVAFRAKGDSIFYPDSTSITAAFKFVGDSVTIGSASYKVVKQASHLFWIENQNGDVVKYTKTDDESYDFEHHKVDIVTYTSVHKTDTVVMWNGERYHAYIAINPTKYRVVCNVLNDDGVEVGNVYYDNIIHVSVYKGAQQIFSSDIKKQQYAGSVPEDILSHSILNDMELSHADANGLHFYTSVCMPDVASCYMLDTRITYDGKLNVEIVEKSK